MGRGFMKAAAKPVTKTAEQLHGAAVAFLASRNPGFITGTTMVDGGGLSIRGDAGEDPLGPPTDPRSGCPIATVIRWSPRRH